MTNYRILDGADERDASRAFAEDVARGLSSSPKRLPSKWLYDAEGSRLFRRITELTEYYPTRAEAEILHLHRADILGRVADGPLDLVDLGAGDGRKTMLLLEWLRREGRDFRYVPIDISESAVRGLVGAVGDRLPGVEIEGLVSQYAAGLAWLRAERGARRRLALFLGSSVGNLARPEAVAFLRGLSGSLAEGDHVLVGFDLKKDIGRLVRAYDDRHGVTAQFNLNLLARINRELGGRFDLTKFRHYATWDVVLGAVESWLVSVEAQVVPVEALGRAFAFEAWEGIHTEHSHKYLESDVSSLAAESGFVVEAGFTDHNGWFLDSLWRVGPRSR
jgi:dimethylhistidine N-methyltransferase